MKSYVVLLVNRSLAIGMQGRLAEAEPLYGRSQAILEKVLDPDHPDLATTLNDRAQLLKALVRANNASKRSKCFERMCSSGVLDVILTDI